MLSTDIPTNPTHFVDLATKEHISSTLAKCHNIRVRYYNILFNVAIVVVFICVVGGVLYYKYTTKPTRDEVNYKLVKDQEYVLSKIRYYQEQQKNIKEASAKYSSMLTDLPTMPMAVGI